MNPSICGIDCSQCELKKTCHGCDATNGSPFGNRCVIASCCKKKSVEHCSDCPDSCRLMASLIAEFNALNIEHMPEVTSLNALRGAFVNLEYTLPSGQTVKYWDDDKIYLGNQLCKKDSDRCYGLTGDENYLMVCEYGNDGADPEIIVYKKRR